LKDERIAFLQEVKLVKEKLEIDIKKLQEDSIELHSTLKVFSEIYCIIAKTTFFKNFVL